MIIYYGNNENDKHVSDCEDEYLSDCEPYFVYGSDFWWWWHCIIIPLAEGETEIVDIITVGFFDTEKDGP